MAQKNYIGRTNRNGTKVTRATFDRLSHEWAVVQLQRRLRRAERWETSHYPDTLPAAPRHIRQNIGQ